MPKKLPKKIVDCDAPCKTEVEHPELTGEYGDGAMSFADGSEETSCPYPIGDGRRSLWYSGYYSARTFKNVGHILKKHGVPWP